MNWVRLSDLNLNHVASSWIYKSVFNLVVLSQERVMWSPFPPFIAFFAKVDLYFTAWQELKHLGCKFNQVVCFFFIRQLSKYYTITCSFKMIKCLTSNLQPPSIYRNVVCKKNRLNSTCCCLRNGNPMAVFSGLNVDYKWGEYVFVF